MNIRPEPGSLASDWDRVRARLTKVDDVTAEMLRLAFMFGARCAIKKIMASEGKGVVLVLLSSELRAFDREVRGELDEGHCQADQGGARGVCG